MDWRHMTAGALALYLLRDKTIERVRNILDTIEFIDCDKESEYKEGLVEILREEIKDCYIETEHGLGRGRRDIWIRNRDSGKTAVIEIKLELSTSSETKRLIGQLVQYSPDADVLFVVLIDPDPDQQSELEQAIDRTFDENKIEIHIFESE